MRVPMGPNRLKEIVRYVELGGGLIYCGGYFTYQGHYGKGRWYGTPVAGILPLEILPLPDDRIEAPEGAPIFDVDTDHPVTAGIDWSDPPIFMGYNRTGRPRNGGRLLGQHRERTIRSWPSASTGPGAYWRRWRTRHRTGAATSCGGRTTARFWSQAVWLGRRRGEGRSMKLTFEVWPNMPWGRLEAAGPAWNSWGDKPLTWCAERLAEYGYDGIDVIFGKIQGDPGRRIPCASPRSSRHRLQGARSGVRLHRGALDLRLAAPLRPRAPA